MKIFTCRQASTVRVKLLAFKHLRKTVENHYYNADALLSVKPKMAAALHERGLLLDLILETTTTPAVLVAINVQTDLHRDEAGSIVAVSVDADRIKNGKPANWALSSRVGERLERHIEVFRPHLFAGKTDRLFAVGQNEKVAVVVIKTRLARLIG
jgi:hypothetical protein